MTVLYICTPLARLNKGANAVVLEVNCFKVCLSAMMKSCVVVRVKCDDQSVPPLLHLSLSEGNRSFSPFSPVFLCFLRVNDALAREHVARFFFWISSLFGRNQGEEEQREFFCVPFALSLSLSLSLSRERKKNNSL